MMYNPSFPQQSTPNYPQHPSSNAPPPFSNMATPGISTNINNTSAGAEGVSSQGNYIYAYLFFG